MLGHMISCLGSYRFLHALAGFYMHGLVISCALLPGLWSVPAPACTHVISACTSLHTCDQCLHQPAHWTRQLLENMSKSHQFVSSQQPGPSRETPVKTNWNRCVLCQEETPEALQCPANSKRHDVGVGAGYSTLSANLIRFSELNQLPIPIDLSRLDEGNGIEATFMENGAKWHKCCHTKFNVTKEQRRNKYPLKIVSLTVHHPERRFVQVDLLSQ